MAHALNLEPNAINSVAYPFSNHSIVKWPVKYHKIEEYLHLHAVPLLASSIIYRSVKVNKIRTKLVFLRANGTYVQWDYN